MGALGVVRHDAFVSSCLFRGLLMLLSKSTRLNKERRGQCSKEILSSQDQNRKRLVLLVSTTG